MKLKSIKIQGFKSFADKIELEIKSNITAIVGPNGSGKSNIVDAIKWVLGAQSVKSLRASKDMVDVIFNGSESRKPLKRAEVALEFDNTTSFLNTDFPQVEIKRILYNTGENEYFINNVKVRLKDLTNLFLDSGIGSDSLNIISQGSIDQIILAKPLDRKVILESASKVLKYKSRKEESLKKLEKANDNLEKVKLVLEELQKSLDPLQEQSLIAKKYLEIEKSLQELELTVITTDIKNSSGQIANLNEEKKSLETQKIDLETVIAKENIELEKNKSLEVDLDETILKLTDEIKQYTLAKNNVINQKQMLIERSKYNLDEGTINAEYLNLQEQQAIVASKIKISDLALANFEEKIKENTKKLNEYQEMLNNTNQKITKISDSLIKNNQAYQFLLNEILVINNNIEQNMTVPPSVKNILNHPHLHGIKGTIASLIDVPKQYTTAISVALSSSANFVVTENENDAQMAIKYLANQKLGRATFFPLTIIKAKKVSDDALMRAQKIPGFIDIAANLVQYDSKYENIIFNQLGNVFITENADALSSLAKALNYQYRIVSLDGQISHTGGSLTGGYLKPQLNLLQLKKQLAEKKDAQTSLEKTLKDQETKKQAELQTKSSIESKINHLQEEKFYFQKEYENEQKNNEKNVYLQQEITNSLKRVQANNPTKCEEQLTSLIKEEKELTIKEETTHQKLENTKDLKNNLFSQNKELEMTLKKHNSELHSLISKINENALKINEKDLSLDYNLTTLNEKYHMTYENALLKIDEDLDIDLAKEKVSELKKELNSFSMVNLGSIDEYERIKERFDFLDEQQKDLLASITDLKEMIKEMDDKITIRLKETFQKINNEFGIVFKELFKGGKGLLKLTDPDNILESGLEIVAEPPGKKLNNIALLSGGEKTLTAIALLFAILNVFPVPFCILDEVEAALDEANVDAFGSYLQKQKAKSEYILITHKKRTMEYADTLYGITMQEQGVSKIVSVNLEKVVLDENEV